jgi:hypothetical protein
MSRDDTFVGSKVLPGGGVAGDVLTKLSSADGDAGWSPVAIPPPVAGDVITNINNVNNYIYNGVLWVPPPGSRGNLRMVYGNPGANTFSSVGLNIGGVVGSAGFVVPNAASFLSSRFRLLRSQGAVNNTSAGAQFVIANNICWRGNGPGLGGFSIVLEWGWDALQAGHRFLAGVSANLADPCSGAEPSTRANIFGLGWDSTDPAFFHLLHNDAAGAAVKTPTTIVPGNATYYYLAIGCAGEGGGLGLTLYTKDSTGLTARYVSPVVTSDIAATNVFFGPGYIINSAATVTNSQITPMFVTIDIP